MALLDLVQQHLGQSEVNQISQQLGVSPSAAQSAISAALPMILGGMARHASQPEGAASVQQAMAAHRDVPDNLSGLLPAGPPADYAGGAGALLGRVLGGHQDAVQQGVQQASGLDAEKTKKLLLVLSPLVLGLLARRQMGGQNATQADPNQVSGALHEEAKAAARQAPHVGGLLGKILGAVEAPRA
jgi:hypothetical protein